MMQVYFENEFVTLSYDLQHQLGMAAWKGDLAGAEFREATLLCQDLVDRYGLTRWLGDNRRMKGIREEDMLWFAEVIMPQLVASSLQRMANLTSEHEKHRESMEQLVQHGGKLRHQLTLRDFDNEQAALEWLLSS